MCLPLAAIAAIGVGVQIAGTVASDVGQNQKAEADKGYNNYLAGVADEQAGEVRVTSALQRRLITEGASRTSQKAAVTSRMVLGSQRAAAAGSGLGGGSVTLENLAVDEANKSVLDDVYIRFQADQQKWASEQEERSQVANLNRQAQGYRMGADAAGVAGGWNTAGTLLSGAGQVADMWYRAAKNT